jgi:V/A-type H+-transporting ATPase subunit I
MIVSMTKIRIMGPGMRLTEVLRVIQDVGVLHLTTPAAREELVGGSMGKEPARRKGQLERALADADAAIAALGSVPSGGRVSDPSTAELARMARVAGRVRQEAERLSANQHALAEEQALLRRYHDLFGALEGLLSARALVPDASAYHVVLRRDQAASLPALRRALGELVGDVFELHTRGLPSGEIAVLLLVPKAQAPKVDRLLAESRVQEIPVPSGYGATLEEALPRMRERASAIPRELSLGSARIDQLRVQEGGDLDRARRAFHDELARLGAVSLSGTTPHAFVLEGWSPEASVPRLTEALRASFDQEVVLERIAREDWGGEDVPVALANPRLFRPFEAITRTLPLPRYGSLDPTPFVAVFFPMFFGLMLGDAGYGALAGLLALVLHRRSRPETTVRAIAEMLGACALFAILFGLAFGEVLGDLGRRWIGLKPLLFDRETALVPFLGLAIALGVVHIVLGLIAGAISRRRTQPRAALGKGLSALMILLIVVALLAAMKILPHGFLTPAVTALLVTFPILIVLEGIVAPVELMSDLGHILSYARIMALGTASVMLAVVANRLAGAVGSVAVGLVFGLLFHLVNFALGLFSPSIHALRLHYVEFFGTFYSPGGIRYQPLSHWGPTAGKPA